MPKPPKTLVQHTTPCGTCPFRKDKPRFFRPPRAEDIVEALRSDRHFICHNHIKDVILCAGSLIVAEKSGVHPNQMARVQMRIGMLDWPKIEQHAKSNQDVYENFDAFLAAQEPL